MLSAYLKIAYRSLLRNRQHAMLNIAGLAISLGVCTLIFLVIRHETSFNTHLSKYDGLYHLVTRELGEQGERYSSGVSFPTIKILRTEYPQHRFGEMMHFTGTHVTVRPTANRSFIQKFYEETPMAFMDSVLADFLDLKIIAGDNSLFRGHDKVLLCRSVAEKYFGDYHAAVGNRINIDTHLPDIEIGGVFEDIPHHSDFPLFMAGSYEYFRSTNTAGWELDNWENLSSNHQVYAYLPNTAEATNFNTFLKDFYTKYHPAGRESKREMQLRAMSTIHFDERMENNGTYSTSWSSIYTLGLVGILILLMACINFINLNTALAYNRSKEIGVRKVLGSQKGHIRLQLYAETALVVIASLILGLLLAYAALPFVKHLMTAQADLQLFSPATFIFIAIAGLITMLFSGFYPAMVLSRFNPVTAIKSGITAQGKTSVLTRKSLVVLQFAVSQVLFIATFVTLLQMQYIKQADLGFNRDAVLNLVVANDSVNASKLESFRNALLARPDIKSVSFAFDAPSSENSWSSNFAFDIMEDKPFGISMKFAEPEYFETYGLDLVAGSLYPKTDSVHSFVVNETFVRKMGLKSPEEALGKMLRLGGQRPKPVTGVVRDFKQESLRTEVVPIVIFPYKRYYSIAGLKLSSTNLQQTREAINQIWDRFFPDIVFQSNFYDEQIEAYYQQDIRLSRLYRFCSLLAIIISCLGLYGLISFMVAQKTREVGIRKVLGAGVGQIVFLFSKDFLILMLIAFLIAAPLAYIFMQGWLSGFVYRITIGPMVFIGSIITSVVAALLAVGFKSYRAATTNPVKSLRNE